MKITVTPLLALITVLEKKTEKNNKREGSENAETLERDLGDTHTGCALRSGTSLWLLPDIIRMN